MDFATITGIIGLCAIVYEIARLLSFLLLSFEDKHSNEPAAIIIIYAIGFLVYFLFFVVLPYTAVAGGIGYLHRGRLLEKHVKDIKHIKWIVTNGHADYSAKEKAELKNIFDKYS